MTVKHSPMRPKACRYACQEAGASSNWCVARLEFQAREKDWEVVGQLHKELILKYAQTEKQLKELDDLKNRYLGMAAHDLRNPLIAIRGFSQMLRDDGAAERDEQQREFMTIIYETSNEMLQLVDDLLDVAVIESGHITLQPVRGSLKEIIIQRIRLQRMVAEKKAIEIKSRFSNVPPLFFDPKRLSQVIDNLLSNAIKFSASGSRIDVRLQQKGGMALVLVKDQGPGLSLDDQKRLFQAFERLGAKPTAGERSTGLGLSIVKKIVEAHKGTLTVLSSQGKGSTFTFSIPLERSDG